jgi:hypothetical protein
MRAVTGLALVTLLLGALAGADAKLTPVYSTTATGTKVELNVPPRFMWGWGKGLRGYCGEFSFQSFGILFGNYLSAENVRNDADGVELLIAVNDEKAAKTLKFDYEEWDYAKQAKPQGTHFMSWVANHIDAGHGVIGGFYEQVNQGDPDYDHIMPIFGYLQDTSATSKAKSSVSNWFGALSGSNKAGGTDRSDVLGIYFNDLYRDTPLYGKNDATFITSRADCKPAGGVQPSDPPYDWCLPKQYDYGIAIKGNRDDLGELVPTQLIMPSWTEPDYGKEDQKHLPIVQFTVSALIEGLVVGSNYAVLRFDRAGDVPTQNFIQGSYSRRFNIVANATTMLLKNFDSFSSDATIFYRTVLM